MAQPAASAGPIAAPALIGVMGLVMEAFPAGALWWADERLLIVADLHLEKGSSYARRGQMLPPYDTHETLTRLALLTEMLRPATILALGDSFHDEDAPNRLNARDAATLAALQAGRDWIWLAGNHDPELASGLHGMRVSSLAIGRLTFRHEPSGEHADGEVAGHLHPAARVYGQGKSVRRRCFAGDGYRLILPAFGAYAGGLDIREQAFAGLFRPDSFRAFVLGEDRVYAVGGRSLRAR